MKIAENDRDMLEYLSEACESQAYVCDQCGHEEALSTFDIASDLRDYMATEQQQSEPVAWIEVADLKEIAKGARWSGTAWGRPADDKGLYRLPPRVPVYTHADPGEVERWKNLHAAMQLQRDHHRDKADTLRAQLAERDALLRYVDDQLTNMQPHIEQACYPGRAGFIDNYVDPVIERIRALSASAEPSVAAEHCESEEIGRVVYAGPERKTVTIRCKLCGHHTIEHGYVIERRLRCVECGSEAFFIILPSDKSNSEDSE